MKLLRLLSAVLLLTLVAGCAALIPADMEKALAEQYATLPLAGEGREVDRRIRGGYQGFTLEVDIEGAEGFREDAFIKRMEDAGWTFKWSRLETRREVYEKGSWGATLTDLKMPEGQVRVMIYELPSK
ncbi:MAG TPA: hypothetical protein VNT75_14750 [Symbiobacteriaceae bacterium]|nr:hypothetical protein [Symbiobacteriaceae bacterium]